jgi:hypothetical protein
MTETAETRDTTIPIFVAGVVAAAIVAVLVNTSVGEGENGGATEMLVSLVFLAVVAAALYFFLLRPGGRSARTAIVVGVVAVLSVAAFWSGLPFLLGATALALGRAASAAGTGARVAQVLGVVAVLAGLVIVVLDQAS